MTISVTHPRHLYRSLLRETTYLFDLNARKWTQEYIKTSFRKHAGETQDGNRWTVPPYHPGRIPSINERHSLKRGRRFLVLLQRANQGYQRQLRGLLQLVYGRKGRVKRKLAAPLIRTDVQDISHHPPAKDATPTSNPPVNASPTKFSKEWKAPVDFISLLTTQRQLSDYLDVRRQIRLNPTVESKNRWGRPMPPSRVKNTTRAWYARMAGALMPPTPEPEWERIKAIAMRTQGFGRIRKRATARRVAEFEEADHSEAAADTLISGPQRTKSRKLDMSIKNPHRMTPRFLSRLYARHILNHSPVVEPNPVARGLISKWDDGRRDTLPAAKPKNHGQMEALFG